MTTELSIPFESSFISGTLHSPLKSDTLVIICHGYTDNKDTPGIIKMAETISIQFAVFRFTFTDFIPHLPTQSKNIQTILNFFKNKYKKIVIVGHSLGGLSVLLSAHQIPRCNGIILINPLVDIKKRIAWKYRKVLLLGIISSPFVKRIRENIQYYFTHLKPQQIHIPTQIIVAKKDSILDPQHGISLYHALASVSKELVVGDNLSHGLDSDENLNFVTSVIINWIQKND